MVLIYNNDLSRSEEDVGKTKWNLKIKKRAISLT